MSLPEEQITHPPVTSGTRPDSYVERLRQQAVEAGAIEPANDQDYAQKRLQTLLTEPDPIGIIHRAVYARALKLGITDNPEIMMNLIGNCAAFADTYTTQYLNQSPDADDGITQKEFVERLTPSIIRRNGLIAKHLKMDARDIREETGIPADMVTYYNDKWHDAYRKSDNGEGLEPFHTQNGAELPHIEIEYAIKADLARAAARAAIKEMGLKQPKTIARDTVTIEHPPANQTQEPTKFIRHTDEPKIRMEPKTVDPGSREHLTGMLTMEGIKGAVNNAVHDRAVDMGITDAGALVNLIGNVTMVPFMSLDMLEQDVIPKSKLIANFAQSIKIAPAAKARAFKKEGLRGTTPDERYPENAVEFYNNNWSNYSGTNPITIENGQGKKITTNDIEQALIADLSIVASMTMAKEMKLSADLAKIVSASRTVG